jgi:hypothetical protein
MRLQRTGGIEKYSLWVVEKMVVDQNTLYHIHRKRNGNLSTPSK